MEEPNSNLLPAPIFAFILTSHRIIESLRLKNTSKITLSVNPSAPCPLSRVAQYNVYTFLEHLKGCRLHHLPGQYAPSLDHSGSHAPPARMRSSARQQRGTRDAGRPRALPAGRTSRTERGRAAVARAGPGRAAQCLGPGGSAAYRSLRPYVWKHGVGSESNVDLLSLLSLLGI